MIFLDLHKVYEELDRDICLEILEGYSMGPRACRIIRTYWDWLQMVAGVGGYYRTEFQGFRGVTQGDTLPPTIFNVVVDAVVRHWVEEMVERAGGQGGRGQEGRHKDSLIDDMMAWSEPGWLQREFITLIGLFDRVGLRKNSGKTVVMVFRQCQVVGNQSEAAYEQRMTSTGPSYLDIQGV